MLLSNKLTYCITAFILLAFAVVPVMAHQPSAGQTFEAAHDGFAADGTTALTGADLLAETGHTHTAAPTVSSITAVDTQGAVTAGGTLVSNVDGRDIVLVDSLTSDDATRVVIALTDHDNDGATADPPTPEQLAAGAFQLKITFSEDVYPLAQAGTTAGAAPTLAADTGAFTGVTLLAATPAGVDLTASFTVNTLTRVQTAGADTDTDTADDEYSAREFLVPVTVAAGITELQLPISIWVTVGADQVYTLTKVVSGNTIQGRGNTEL